LNRPGGATARAMKRVMSARLELGARRTCWCRRRERRVAAPGERATPVNLEVPDRNVPPTHGSSRGPVERVRAGSASVISDNVRVVRAPGVPSATNSPRAHFRAPPCTGAAMEIRWPQHLGTPTRGVARRSPPKTGAWSFVGRLPPTASRPRLPAPRGSAPRRWPSHGGELGCGMRRNPIWRRCSARLPLARQAAAQLVAQQVAPGFPAPWPAINNAPRPLEPTEGFTSRSNGMKVAREAHLLVRLIRPWSMAPPSGRDVRKRRPPLLGTRRVRTSASSPAPAPGSSDERGLARVQHHRPAVTGPSLVSSIPEVRCLA